MISGDRPPVLVGGLEREDATDLGRTLSTGRRGRPEHWACLGLDVLRECAGEPSATTLRQVYENLRDRVGALRPYLNTDAALAIRLREGRLTDQY
jgi:hypothetical protein